MVHQRGEPCLLIRSRYPAHAVQPIGTSCPALRPGRVSLAAFPLARPLSSAASATAVLFGGFAGTTGLSDFPYPFISGVPPQRSLSSRPAITQAGGHGTSRFSRMEIPHMHGRLMQNPGNN